MIKKRNKFWTVVFACMPGAGHMFNGFIQRGLSFMLIFWAVLAVAAFFNLGVFFFAIPVVWFYAFFDCINRRFQDDEEFYSQEDEYLLSVEDLPSAIWIEKRRPIFGWGLILLGCYALWNNVFMGTLQRFFPDFFYRVRLHELTYLIPQLLIAVLIVWAGVALIRGKQQEMEDEDGLDGEEDWEKELEAEDEDK